jgi:hypothetical protein
MARYVEFMLAQIRELPTNYGEISTSGRRRLGTNADQWRASNS